MERRTVPSLFAHAGAEDALHRLEDIFCTSVLADPVLQPLFGAGRPEHVDHLTAFTAESFGGPDRFTTEPGFEHLIDVHRGLRITEPQRARFVELYLLALDHAGMPDDAPFRKPSALMSSSAPRWRCRIRTP
jgi:hemoglobin